MLLAGYGSIERLPKSISIFCVRGLRLVVCWLLQLLPMLRELPELRSNIPPQTRKKAWGRGTPNHLLPRKQGKVSPQNI